MSLYTFLVEKDKVYVGADSRQGMFINGDYYVLNDDASKIFAYKDIICTFGGCSWLCNYMGDVIKNIAQNADWALSVEVIATLFIYACKNRELVLKSFNIDSETMKQALDTSIADLGEMLAVKYDKEKGVYNFYNISSRNDFKLVKVNVTDTDSKDLFICGGFNNETATQAWERRRRLYKNDMTTLFTRVYEDAADEYVGGTLHYIEAEKGRISKRQSIDIKDNKRIKRLDKSCYYLAHNMMGQRLKLMSTRSDGQTQTFRVDGDGVLLDNGNFTLKNMNNEGDGNNVNIDFERGVVVTQNDAKTRVIINAMDGLCIQKGDGQGTPEDALDSKHWTDKPVYINTKGDAVFGGDIHAKRLFLDELGGENILTYIDRTKDKYTSTNEYKPNAGEVKLSGEYLEGRGLKAYDGNGNIRVKIDGKDGSLSIYNGYIKLQSGNNKINIDADNGMVFTKNEEDVVRMDINDGSLYIGGDATFSGTIDTKKDCIVGENLTVGENSASGRINFAGMINDSDGSIGVVDKQMTIEADNITLKPASDGHVYVGNDIVATKDDIRNIQTRLSNIEDILSSLS